VEEVRAVVERVLPDDATVLVVSNGDDELLELGTGRRGWHFPQMDDGTYAGYHPGTSAEALAHLRALEARGAEYIVFPSTTAWWLEYYGELAAAIREGESPGQSRACEIFALTNSRREAAAHG
jgi:hypothetical protein